MKKHKHKKDLVFFAVILILVLVILYSGLRILESTVLHRGSGSGGTIASKTIEVDGVSYFPRQDITVVLVLGIDRFGPVQGSGHYTNTGAADVDMLMIFDQTDQVVNMLYLNRDTMLTMPALGVGGKPAGTYYGQLALAHTYGEGLQDSCENSRKAISDFLWGLRIDYYVSMNMDAIALINDAVGGVTVEVTEDFSLVDPTIPMGTVKLTGQQALNFVRTRKDVGDQLNVTRMERQMTYIRGFSQALKAKHETDATFVLNIYEELKPYVVTDCSGKVLASLLERYATYELGQILSPKGENVMGQKYYEFHVDETDLQRIMLELFYAPKQ
jgi:LCP family protein required for cell wall assembly